MGSCTVPGTLYVFSSTKKANLPYKGGFISTETLTWLEGILRWGGPFFWYLG